MGLILFGLIFGYLTMCRWEVLLHSYFLAGLGLLVLVVYIVLAHIYWFRAPLMGVSFRHAVLRCGTCWGICRRMKLSSAEDFRPIDNPIRTLWLLVDILPLSN